MPRMVAIGAVLGFGLAVLLLALFGGNAPPRESPQPAPAQVPTIVTAPPPHLPRPVRRDLVPISARQTLVPPALAAPTVAADGGR